MTIRNILLFNFLSQSNICIFYFINQTSVIFDDNFLTALNDNFFEYFLFFHSLPIGNIIIAKIYLFFSEFLDPKTYYYILNCLYSLLSFLII